MKNLLLAVLLLTSAFSTRAQQADSLKILAMLDSLSIVKSYSGYHYYQPRLDTNNLYYYAYSDTSGVEHRLTQAVFEDAENFADDFAMVKYDGKYGYIDTLGKIAIPCVYDNASSFSNNVAIVFADCKTGIVDQTGKLTLLAKDYEYVYPFVENRAVVVEKGRYGVINKSGEEVVNPIYKNIVPYSNSLAIVTDTTTNLQGAIDTTGQIVYPPIYGNMESFNRFGYSEVANYSVNKKRKHVSHITKKGLVSKQGKTIVPVEYDNVAAEYPENWFRNSRDEDFLIVAYNLKKIKEDHYIKSKFIRWLKYRVFKKRRKKKNKINYAIRTLKDNTLFDNSGKKLHYDTKNIIGILDNQHAFTINKKELRLVNIKGDKKVLNKLNIDFKADRSPFRNNVIMVENKKGKLGVIDFDGNVEIEVAYDKIQEMTDDSYFYGDKLYMAYKDDTIIAFNSLYKPVKKIVGDKINKRQLFTGEKNKYGEPVEKTVFIVYKDKKCGILDAEYNVILPVNYDKIYTEFDRVIYSIGGKYGIMDEKLKVIKEFDNYTIATGNDYYVEDGNYIIKDKKKVGFIDKDGKIVLQPLYTKAFEINRYEKDPLNDTLVIENKYFNVFIGKKEGVLSADEKVILPIKYDNINFFRRKITAKLKKKVALFTFEGVDLTGFIYDDIASNTGYSYSVKEKYIVTVGKKSGVTDSLGKVIIPIIYDRVEECENHMFFYVTTKGLTGVVNESNQTIVPQQYSGLYYNFANNSFFVFKDSKSGVVDINGKVVIPVEYDDVEDWRDDLYMIRKGNQFDGKYGVVNNNGKVIIPADYERSEISYYRNTIILDTGGKKFFYNSQGDPVNDCYIDKHIGTNGLYDDYDY